MHEDWGIVGRTAWVRVLVPPSWVQDPGFMHDWIILGYILVQLYRVLNKAHSTTFCHFRMQMGQGDTDIDLFLKILFSGKKIVYTGEMLS